MTTPQFHRAELAITFGPAYRKAALAYYQLADDREWRMLGTIERERWIELAKVALMVNRQVITGAFGSPTAAGAHSLNASVDRPTPDRGDRPGAAGGGTAHFSAPAGQTDVAQVRDGALENRENAGGAAAGEPAQLTFHPLRRYQP